MQHDLTKHIKITRHFIKKNLDSGLIYTPYVSIDHQLANITHKRFKQ